MNDLLQNFLQQLKQSSAGAKLVAALVGAGLVMIVGVAAVVSNRPDYQLAFSGLSDHELPKVTKALADSGISFEVSQPPAPFAVFVDESDRSAAYKSAYGAGALDKPLKGILSDQGVASVFNSAEERSQAVRKREWEEMEKMLELLDFVVSAQVRTSPGNSSPLARASATPTTASVTLRIVGNEALSKQQSQTVANLVSRGLGVGKSDMVISDQSGISLYDGEDDVDDGKDVRDLLSHQTDYDERMTVEANGVLETILGPQKAHVTITSEWDFDQSTTRTETTAKGTVLSETKNSTERPLVEGGSLDIGGATGVSANVAAGDAALDPADTDAKAEEIEPPVEKTNEERKDYRPSTTLEEKVRFVPQLSRLSLALFLDASIAADQAANLEEAVKAAVGFVDTRDTFRSVMVPFFVDEVAEDPAADTTATPETPAEPNPLVEKLLERGLEIGVGLVFLVLLLRSLKTSSKTRQVSIEPTKLEDEIDPELLARAQIEELLKSDPDKVGSILSSWARGGDRPVTGARQ